MTTTSRERIIDDLLGLLEKLAGDWDYDDEITLETRFFADMGLGSLDLVMLGTAVQEHYGRRFPFVEFFAELGRSGRPDIPVSEWVEFIHAELRQPVAPPAAAAGSMPDRSLEGS